MQKLFILPCAQGDIEVINMNNKVIEIKNLSYSYPDGTSALKNITIDILEGESIGLVGPNGAGKSSLLLHLNGILKTA